MLHEKSQNNANYVWCRPCVSWQVNVTSPTRAVKVVEEVVTPRVILEVSRDAGQAARQDQK